MKIQQITKVLIVAAAITCVSYSAQAQSAGVRAATRAHPPSTAEQVRRDANSIRNCRPANHAGSMTAPGNLRYNYRCLMVCERNIRGVWLPYCQTKPHL
jgi:hypothetical protein